MSKTIRYGLTSLLLGHTNSPSSATSGLGVLSTHTDSPVVTETTVSPDLLQALKVISELDIQEVRCELGRFSVSVISLSVEEPVGDLELAGVGEDGHYLLNVFGSDFTGSFAEVNVSLLADQVRESAAASLNGSKGVHHLASSINVGVLNTKDVLEVVLHNKGPHLCG